MSTREVNARVILKTLEVVRTTDRFFSRGVGSGGKCLAGV